MVAAIVRNSCRSGKKQVLQLYKTTAATIRDSCRSYSNFKFFY